MSQTRDLRPADKFFVFAVEKKNSELEPLI